MPACQDCIHFADIRPPYMDTRNSKTALYGQCRRLPPTIHMFAGNLQAHWPAVIKKNDWCSEFKAKANE
jgi:hypothetical protein